jgi:hypothetical protein
MPLLPYFPTIITSTIPLFTNYDNSFYLARFPARSRTALPLPCSDPVAPLSTLPKSVTPSSFTSFIIGGVPPKLTNTAGFVAVSASKTLSSCCVNHLGIRNVRSGISAIIKTGKPIAAMVCEMATVHATPRIWMPMKSHIFFWGTVLSGLSRWMKRCSDMRYINFARMPLDSMEPHYRNISVCSEV